MTSALVEGIGAQTAWLMENARRRRMTFGKYIVDKLAISSVPCIRFVDVDMNTHQKRHQAKMKER